ncbi:DUF6293 family protein [Methanocella paludicola]|nr:DUF6293 family protein [Methanocella paludicola]
MDMTKPGVHIIPAGLEYDRVIKPLFKDFTVQKAYLLVQNPKSDKGYYKHQTDVVNSFLKEIKRVPIEWEDCYIDLYDFNSTFKTAYKLIEKEVKKGNPVYVNISSAPRMVQVALIMASFLNRREDAIVELYYIEPEKYYEGELVNTVFKLLERNADEKQIIKNLKGIAQEIKEHGMASGEATLHKFPPFPIAKVTDIEYDMLKVIKEKTVEHGSNNGNGYIESIKELKELLDRSRGSETPRSNVKYYLDNLQEMGLIETERNKKELKICLTVVGKIFADTKSN